jgi:ferredoxin--NADP+ reductase
VPYVVTQPCCTDASCVLACPVNCIHPAPGEPGFGETEMVFIDADTCVGCGACVTACPVGAIVPDHVLSPGERPFQELAADYYDAFPHADRTPVALVPRPRRLEGLDFETRRAPRRWRAAARRRSSISSLIGRPSRARSGRARRARVAVVGAGPAGHYAADALLKQPGISVDVLDRRPVPHGLVRYGVAPDHEHTRGVARLLEAIAGQPGFRYRLGVEVASAAELAEYDAVVWATGASTDRRLDVPGGGLPGVVGATSLARWSNGDPELAGLDVSVAGGSVVVGAGNVALDMARLLVGPRVGAAEVVVLGRRGPGGAAFTTPELIGLASLDGVDVVLEGPPPAGTGVRARVLADLARRSDLRTPRPGRPRIALRFHVPVAEVLGAHRATGVRLADGEVVAADLVVTAIGHEWTPLEHDRGRLRPGEYVVGWAKRGPSGFIGTNKACAEETVALLLDDLEAGGTRSLGRGRGTGRNTLSRIR